MGTSASVDIVLIQCFHEVTLECYHLPDQPIDSIYLTDQTQKTNQQPENFFPDFGMRCLIMSRLN